MWWKAFEKSMNIVNVIQEIFLVRTQPFAYQVLIYSINYEISLSSDGF